MTHSALMLDRGTRRQVVEDFEKDGFAVIPDLLSQGSIKNLVDAYDDILEGRIDCGMYDRDLGGLTRQVMLPHLMHPAFLENEAVVRARELAVGLTKQPEPEINFSMLIFKPPGHPHATPWHQDMAYMGHPFAPAGVKIPNYAIAQFWLALDDVEENMGCMEFVPGMQDAPMLEHHVASGDPQDNGRLLAIVDADRHIDQSKIVRCPLKAGSATVHSYATPHYTGPNRSLVRGRRAFIFSFINNGVLEAVDRSDWG